MCVCVSTVRLCFCTRVSTRCLRVSVRPHVSSDLSAFVTVCVCFARRLSCRSVPSVRFCSSVLFVVVRTVPTLLLLLPVLLLLLLLPPFISSLPLYLPHRLPNTLHKARIAQATPFHLLSSSLKFIVLSPSSLSCSLHSSIWSYCPILTDILLCLCFHVQRFGVVVAPFLISK